ncbi:4Fe-4S dicluster domain-containing protein [Amantichitinum ursilacus]|uniref:2-oxoglutarate-acceptor oxidoreductase subunit OorD n=1 Tax=Amantichitinum ursilacus TaxID=857265 RepID=A0A0N0GM65_9NEIS|nr:ferredoxin family protein [Amantichitinum ursilacus]KPC50657.1 2-oxoglutarate-acceptor oxidoreductase subunit OorD [Amantichitinum ursilacus]
MIEWISSDRCTGCNQCVAVCPTNVLQARGDSTPLIARADDCQSCFMCELYCKQDAIFVGGLFDAPTGVTEEQAVAHGWLGQYRKHSGWDEWADQYANEHWRMDRVFALARAS